MMYDELDWEDIESRLYSQVYHASADSQDHTSATISNINDEVNLQNQLKIVNIASKTTKQNRYFHTEKNVLRNPPIYISIEQNQNMTTPDSLCKSVQNNITFRNEREANSSNGYSGQFQNNITVNQYSIPVIINSELHETSNRYKKFLERKEKKRQKRLAKKRENKEKRRKRKNEQGDLNNLLIENVNENSERKVNDVICVSDESNSECIIVHDTSLSEEKVIKSQCISTEFPKKYNEDDENCKKPESDDDIIYIPPPPVEVINIDGDENKDKVIVEENQQKNEECCVQHEVIKSKVLPNTSDSSNFSKPHLSNTYNPRERRELLCTPESSVSNDFLENASIENNTNKFNFSLHGSDFHSVSGDFLRPANPVEFCETESSGSTNECNRVFNNSVKTIIFDEVEFPKADIFADNNLESFGTYITPKRKCSSQINAENSGSTVRKESEDSITSDSSSESDFEPSESLASMKECRKLPSLSPMQFNETKAVLKKKTKKKIASEFKEQPNVTKKDVHKRKSDVVEISETDSDCGVEKLSDTKKKTLKKKYKINTIEEQTHTAKKKKGNFIETTLECEKRKKHKNSDHNLEKPLNNRKKDVSQKSTSDNEELEGLVNSDTPQRKAKKALLEFKNSENEKKKKQPLDYSNFNSSEYSDAEVLTKRKKKKSGSLESTQIPEHEEIAETMMAGKAKKKKSISSGNSENGDILETKSKKRRKSCSTSSNKSVDVSETEEYIEVELLDEADVEVAGSNKNDVYNLEAELCKLSEQNNCQVNEFVENIEKIPDDVEHTTEHNANDSYDELVGFVTISEISNVQDTEQNDSDEEIVVDDETNSNLSSLIVVDEVNCTITDQQYVKVLSSDSENDIDNSGPTDVGDNIELANCIPNAIDKREEFIVVDDNSESNSAGHLAFQRSSREFDVIAIQRTQTDDPDAWEISHKDRMADLYSDRYRSRCDRRRLPPKCSLCGSPGHEEPRCTKKICTQCGNEGDYSTSYCWKCFKFRNVICRICNMKGHIAKTCPDLWRRYHLTTEEGPIVVSQEPQLKPRDEQWCSGCAKRGHLEHECDYYYRAYPPTTPCIMSYADVFYDDTSKLPREASYPVVDGPPRRDLISSMAGTSSSNIPPLMSIQLPIPPSNQYHPTISSYVRVGASLGTPLPPELDYQEDHQARLVQNGANYIIELPNRVQTLTETLNPSPSSVGTDSRQVTLRNPVLDQMRLIYLNELHSDVHVEGLHIDPHNAKEGIKEFCRIDQRRIKHIIMSMAGHKVREFLKKEMADLDDVATQSNPKFLKGKLFKYDSLWRSKKPLTHKDLKEQCFWNRVLNMFIFGVHKCRDGKLHLNYLQRYLSEPKGNKLDLHKRRSLFNSYCYIFGGDRHANVSYRRVINQIMRKCDRNRNKCFL